MANVFVLVVLACASIASAAQQSEWSVPHGGLSSDENRASTGDSFTTAFLNVTYEDRDGGFVWDSNEVAKYGEGYVGPAYGYIVHVGSKSDPDEHTGCSWPLTDSSAEDGRLPIPGTKWIALIKRGKCNFELKVSNAYRSNASGVIIYNDRDAAQLDKMKLSTDRQRNMSAVFTYKWKGEELAKMVNDGYSVTVYISVASHCTRTYNNINRTSVLFVSISFIVLMIISLAWLVFYYIQRFRYIHAKDRLSKRLCCAAKKALSKIPVKNLKSEDKEVQGDGECCAVCIEPYKVSDLLRVLPCRHDFHKSCIDPWLLEHRTCPMCKMDILKYYGFVFTGSQESILQLDVEDGRASRTTARALSPPPRVLHGRGLATDNSFEIPDSQRSSRASSPDEMTPSLRGTPQSQTQQNSLGGLPRSEASTPSLHQSPTRQIVCEVSPDRKVPLRDTNSSDERRD